MIRGLFRRAAGALLALFVVLLLIGVMASSCDDDAKEAIDGLSGSSMYTPVYTPPQVPEVTEVPEAVRLDGNRLTGLQKCTKSGYGSRSLKVYVETDGVWSRQSQCFIFTESKFFGLYDDWSDLMMEALPTADKPDGLWYRIPLLHSDGSIEFVWGNEQQVFADVVTLDGVVRP